MDIGDRIEIPVYISPSGKARPWSRTQAPAPGTPKEQGEVVSIAPPQVAMDNGILGPFEPSYATVVGGPPLTAQAPVGFPAATQKAYKLKSVLLSPGPAPTPVYDAVSNPIGGGVCCQRCRELNPYVEPSAGPYTCYACRQDPWRFAT